MTKTLFVILALTSAFALQGCSTTSKKNSSPANNNVLKDAKPSQLVFLTQCLKNAEMLAKLNPKQSTSVNELRDLISTAKNYAAFAESSSENVKSTITPLFEYKINYKCNSISQQLIDEFNNKSKSL